MSEESRAVVNRLISDTRQGSESALAELIKRYEPLMLSLMSRYLPEGISNEDKEDIRQEMLIVFCNAVMKYDLNQHEVDFGLYVKICMQNGLVSQLRAVRRRITVEQMPEEDIPHFDDPSSDIIESESIHDMWKLINKNLSEYENAVWNLHLSGAGSKDIAEQFGRDVKSIDNALCRIRAKLRKALKQQKNDN